MLSVVVLVVLLAVHASVANATVLFSRIADDTGTVDTGVSTAVMDYTQSESTPNSRFFYRNDTPVPGRTLYFRNDFQNAQHDAGNVMDVTQIDLTTGQTYYLGGFFRFDRIGGVDVWHDTNGPDSYDKLFEFGGGNFRWIILAGWPNGNYTGSYNGKYTHDIYVSPAGCTNCTPSEKWANVSPYGQTNPYLCDYGRWYAVVMKITLSTGAPANDGLIELFLNGTKTTSLSMRTQDSTTPFLTRFDTGTTVAQPANDAPAHYRKMDHLIFATSLTDVQNAGLMSDPEAGGGVGGEYPIGTKRLAPMINLRRGN